MTAVVVLGAGIVGASITYHLARAGARVTLLDAREPASGATGSSFAWIGRGPEADRPEQAALRAHVLADHHRLEAEVPGVRVRWTGSLSWGAQVRPGAAAGDRSLLGAAEVAHLEPALRHPPPAALRVTGDGALDPTAVVHALLAAAREHGATTRTGVSAHRLRLRDGRVAGVETSDGFVAAGHVVVATGAAAPLLCAPLGFELPVVPSPAVLLRFATTAEVVRTLVSDDRLDVRRGGGTTLLVAREHRGETTPAQLRATGAAVLAELRAAFAGTDDLELLGVEVGLRPVPVDGAPVVGPVPGAPGAYLAVMHSGVTLAPTVGRLVAAELLDGVDAVELAGLRPARFARAPG